MNKSFFEFRLIDFVYFVFYPQINSLCQRQELIEFPIQMQNLMQCQGILKILCLNFFLILLQYLKEQNKHF